MTIQINTDKNINGTQALTAHLNTQISEGLSRYTKHITRIEVHLSDEDGQKEGFNAKRCLIEARMEGRQPIAVTNQADSLYKAVSEALDKLKASLETVLGRLSNH